MSLWVAATPPYLYPHLLPLLFLHRHLQLLILHQNVLHQLLRATQHPRVEEPRHLLLKLRHLARLCRAERQREVVHLHIPLSHPQLFLFQHPAELPRGEYAPTHVSLPRTTAR